MKKMATLVLILTALTTALIAGLFYAYSCSVNPGLARLNNREYIIAMQSINEAILNPLFFLSFMGTLILLPVSCYLHYQQPRFVLLLFAMVTYLGGTFCVTIFGNVPLNNVLAQFNAHTASLAEIAHQRKLFEMPWNTLHTVRTISSVISLLLVIVACERSN